MNFIFQLHVWFDHSLCEEVVAEPSSSHKAGNIAYDVERETKEDVSPPYVLPSSPGGGVLHQFWPGSSSEYISSGSTEVNCGGDNILSSRRRHEDQQDLLVEEHCVAMKYQQSTSSGDLHQRLSEFQVALRTSERCDPPSLLLSWVCMGSAKVFPHVEECKERSRILL